MKHASLYVPLTLALVVPMMAAALPAQAGDHAAHTMVTPDQIAWTDVTALPAGAEGAVLEGKLDQPGPFILRLRLPANYRIPPHHHPAIEHVTVLSGTFRMATGDTFEAEALVDLPPGSIAIMPTGVNHFAANAGPVELQLHGMGPWGITYVDPANDPRKPPKP